jgi:nitrogen fixation protein FixH
MARIALIAALTLGLAACHAQTQTFTSVAEGKVADTLVAFQTPDGRLKTGSQEVRVTFSDVASKPAVVMAPALNLSLAPGGGASSANLAVTLNIVEQGVYSANVDLGAQGKWQGQIVWSQGGKPQMWRFSTMVI